MRTLRFLLLAVALTTGYLTVVFVVVEPLVVEAFNAPETFDLLPPFHEVNGFIGLVVGWVVLVGGVSLVMAAIIGQSLLGQGPQGRIRTWMYVHDPVSIFRAYILAPLKRAWDAQDRFLMRVTDTVREFFEFLTNFSSRFGGGG